MTKAIEKACADYMSGYIDAMQFRATAKDDGKDFVWCDDKLDELDRIRNPEYFAKFG